MITSSKIQNAMLEILSDCKEHSVKEIKEKLNDMAILGYSEGQFAGSINTLQSNGSIEKLDRGIYRLKNRSDNMKKCFIVCPIGNEDSDIRKRSDDLCKYIIKPICEACNFTVIRADKINNSNSITKDIMDNLENDDLVIADITNHNPNVFYEIGYRARTNKPIIYLKNKEETLPFDINTIRTYDYDLHDLGSVENLKKSLQDTIKSFDYSNSCNKEESGFSSENMINTLNQILTSINLLGSEIKQNNAETIKVIMSEMKSYNNSNDGVQNTKLQMSMLKYVIDNPESIEKLSKIAAMFPQK